MYAGSWWIILGGGGIFTVIVMYPLLICLWPRTRRPVSMAAAPALPPVALIVAARNAATLLPAKLANVSRLDYPPGLLTCVIASDASTDGTRDVVQQAVNPHLRFIEQTQRAGKAAALNRAVKETASELVLFSDADALLAPDAVRKLVRHFSDPDVGGVCGQRVVSGGTMALRGAQETYIHLDSKLKAIESEQGRITSNDGKLYMIRRVLFQPIPPDVTDDLYSALSVISQGYRFVFEPGAVAEIGIPSRSIRHEIQRRRRIVTRSLTGILRMRHMLNPLRYGRFALGLLINKVGRRLLPFFLVAVLIGLARLSLAVWSPVIVFAAVAAVVAGGGVLLWLPLPSGSSWLLKPLRAAQYALAGFVGTAWGVCGFLMGRRVRVWEPVKTGTPQGMNP